jgi:tetratricopeptide (TPR) repeat protein
VFVVLFLIITFSASGYARLPQKAPPPNDNLQHESGTARQLVAEAKVSALKIKNSFQRGLVLDEIGAAEAKFGDLDAAVETVNQAYPNTMATLTAIGEQLGESSNYLKAEAIRPKLKGGGSSTVFAFMARQQAKKGNIAEALGTTDKIQAPEVRSDALEWIGQQQIASRDYAGAQRTFALAKAADPNRHSSPDDVEVMLAEAQLAEGNTEEARLTLSSMKSPEARFLTMFAFAEVLSRKGDKVSASAWLEDALLQLPTAPANDFSRYFTIPLRVRLGQKERALRDVATLSADFRIKGYLAMAVVCAEMKDLACVHTAVAAMKSATKSDREAERRSDFGLNLMILDVTAALIDNGQLEAASRLLAPIEQRHDDGSWKRFIEPHAQLQRVFVLAQQNNFKEARALALNMQPDSVSDVQRGTALCTIALLQTNTSGVALSQSWASALTDHEDRAYALLGIAQALLKTGDVKLHYSAIQIH